MNKKDFFDVVFFDVKYMGLERFANQIAKHLKSISPELKIGGIYTEEQANVQKLEYIDYIYLQKTLDIKTFFENCKVMLFFANRIPDLEIILYCKHYHIITISMQHGNIFKGANPNAVDRATILATLKYFSKFLRYQIIAYKMCIYAKMSYLGLIRKVLSEKSDISKSVQEYFQPSLVCDYAFVLGEKWIEYFEKVYGYKREKISNIGYYELDNLNCEVKPEEAVCYIAQTMVEDGTITKGEFLEFIELLRKYFTSEKQFYIKLHPRSDMNLYKNLKGNNILFVRDEIPYVNTYIAHRSTLLGKAFYISNDIILWKFKNEHKPFYAQFTDLVCSNEQELIIALEHLKNCKRKKSDSMIQEYYTYNEKGAFFSAAENIKAILSKGEES